MKRALVWPLGARNVAILATDGEGKMRWQAKVAYAVGTIGALWLGIYLAVRYDRPAQILAATMAGVAIATFVAFYQERAGEDASSAMRRAIAGSVVVVWFVFFGLLVFSPTLQGVAEGGRYEQRETSQRNSEQAVGQQDLQRGTASAAGGPSGESMDSTTTADEGESQADKIGVARSMVDDFRWVMIAVIGSYFTSEGALAAVKVWRGAGGAAPEAGGGGSGGGGTAKTAPRKARSRSRR